MHKACDRGRHGAFHSTHPTHSVSTAPVHPHYGAALLQKTALTQRTHGHSSLEFTQGHARIQRPGKNVHKFDPTHELATTNARAKLASGHKADRYNRTNHPERLGAHHPGYTTHGGRWPSHTSQSRCRALLLAAQQSSSRRAGRGDDDSSTHSRGWCRS